VHQQPITKVGPPAHPVRSHTLAQRLKYHPSYCALLTSTHYMACHSGSVYITIMCTPVHIFLGIPVHSCVCTPVYIKFCVCTPGSLMLHQRACCLQVSPHLCSAHQALHWHVAVPSLLCPALLDADVTHIPT
jgi:hypothetical protein